MFDGDLMAEALRARILLQLAEARLGAHALVWVGGTLITFGQWLKARATTLPPVQPVESLER